MDHRNRNRHGCNGLYRSHNGFDGNRGGFDRGYHGLNGSFCRRHNGLNGGLYWSYNRLNGGLYRGRRGTLHKAHAVDDDFLGRHRINDSTANHRIWRAGVGREVKSVITTACISKTEVYRPNGSAEGIDYPDLSRPTIEGRHCSRGEYPHGFKTGQSLGKS